MSVLKKLIAVIGVIAAALAVIGIIKKPSSVYKNKPEEKNPMEGKRVRFVADNNEKENADGVRGHLEAVGNTDHKAGVYEKYVKRCIDILLSFGGLVVLSPVFLFLSLWIMIDDPGPVLFTSLNTFLKKVVTDKTNNALVARFFERKCTLKNTDTGVIYIIYRRNMTRKMNTR